LDIVHEKQERLEVKSVNEALIYADDVNLVREGGQYKYGEEKCSQCPVRKPVY
jgi:hypothetical protein